MNEIHRPYQPPPKPYAAKAFVAITGNSRFDDDEKPAFVRVSGVDEGSQSIGIPPYQPYRPTKASTSTGYETDQILDTCIPPTFPEVVSPRSPNRR